MNRAVMEAGIAVRVIDGVVRRRVVMAEATVVVVAAVRRDVIAVLAAMVLREPVAALVVIAGMIAEVRVALEIVTKRALNVSGWKCRVTSRW